jgi:hypothetical protein
MGLLLNHHSELGAGHMKISEDLSKSKDIVFNVKKLSNKGMNLTLQ